MKVILVVEDVKAIREALVIKLKKIGYDVFEALDGKEGLEIALKERPELVITDLIMPVMDGFELIHELRNDGRWGKKVDIMILTNLSPNSEIYNKIADPKPLYYMIKKDWTLDELCTKVEEVLGFPGN